MRIAPRVRTSMPVWLAALFGCALALQCGAPAARAAEAMTDAVTPEPEAPAPAEIPPAEPTPLVPAPNPVVPGGMTVDLRGLGEQPLNATVGRDGAIRMHHGDAPEGE